MRKVSSKKRMLMPDPRFNDTLVTRFINNLMYDGKKNLAYDLFYEAMDIIEEKTKESGLEIWRKALTNVTPQVEVRSRRVGGATFQIPQEVRPERKVSLGIKWMILYARK